MNFSSKLKAVLRELNEHHGGAGFANPRTIPKTLADIPLNSAAPQQFSWGGMRLGLSSASHASAALQVAFDELPVGTDDSAWFNLQANGSVRRPDGLPFKRFFARLQSGVTQSALRKCIFVIDNDPTSGNGDTINEGPRLGNVTVGGKMQVEVGFLNLAGADVSGVASDEGAAAVSGWTGAAYARMSVDASGRVVVVGPAAAGAPAAGNPILSGVYDLSTGNVQRLASDSGGRAFTVAHGINNAGTSVAANVTAVGTALGATPNTLMVGGSDGTNARVLQLTSTGSLVAAGFDGSTTRSVLVDTSGRHVVVGAAADAAAAAGNPVLVAANFAGNAKTLPAAASNSTTTISGLAADARLAVHAQGSTTIGTLWNAAVVGAGGTSTAFAIYGHRRVEVFGNVSAATTLSVQFSQDGATFFDATSGTAAGQTPNVVLAGAGNFSLSFDTGAPYFRLKSTAAATITAIFGAKN